MPELPEVHTTATMLDSLIKNERIVSVWTIYNSKSHVGKDNIKNPKFFETFKKEVINGKFTNIYRRGKNVLMELNNGKTILVHMKMTGHLLYGKYALSKKNIWEAKEKGPLQDAKNQFIRFVITLSNGKNLVLSDMRKFAKVTVYPTDKIHSSVHLKDTGPEPLEKNFNLSVFVERLRLRPNGKIKQVLLDPKILAGVGNIYSDEMLFLSGIHPFSIVKKIPEKKFSELYKAMKLVLKKGIDFGGDSTSDYRNPLGEFGKFHHHHQAYRNTGKACEIKNCNGVIQKLKFGGRSAHFCNKHQILYK
jgi:formamidopyrimidine-DNA glycosylase